MTALRVAFAGDATLGGAHGAPLVGPALAAVLDTVRHAVVNLEGPVTTAPPVRRDGVALRNPPYAVRALRAAGFDLFGLANNHTMDAGPAGLHDTTAAVEAAGGTAFGAGSDLDAASRPVVLEGNGIRVGVLGITHREGPAASARRPGPFMETDLETLRRRTRALRGTVDRIVLVYHGGEEYTHQPMPRRRRLLRRLARWVDVVVAHHPHVVQGHELARDALVCYSLGNFAFAWPGLAPMPGTDDGLLLVLEFTPTAVRFEGIATRYDRATGTVDLAPNASPHFAALPHDYRARWQAECYRVLFAPGGHSTPPAGSGRPRLWLRRVGRLPRALAARNLRPIVLGALWHRVRVLLGGGRWST